MARRRKPSVGLIILFIILIILYLFLDQLILYISLSEGRGTISYSYVAGDEAITSIVFTLPQDLVEVMVLETIVGWTATLEGNTLSLSGGTLNPGETVHVQYYLARYIRGGTKTLVVKATTATGGTLTTEGAIGIPEAVILNILGQIANYKFLLLVLAAIVLLAIILLVVVGKKEEEKEVRVIVTTEPTKPTEPQPTEPEPKEPTEPKNATPSHPEP